MLPTITATSLRSLLLITFYVLLSLSCQGDQDQPGALPTLAATSEVATPTRTHPSPTPSSASTTPPKATTTPANPSPSPISQAEAFLPSEMEPITVGNASSLASLAELGSPGIYLAAFSPNGIYLATAAQDQPDRGWSVQLWDLRHGQPLGKLSGGPIFSFSADGAAIATAGVDGGLSIWDTASGQLLQELESDPILALSAGWEMRLVSAGHDPETGTSTVELLSGFDQVLLHRFSVAGAVAAGRFSPSGEMIAVTTGGLTSETTFWDTVDGQLIRTLVEVDRLVISPDGRALAGLFGPERSVQILTLDEWTTPVEIAWQSGLVPQQLTFSPDGAILAAPLGNQVVLWETSSGRLLSSLEEQAGYLAFSADGSLMAAVDFGAGVTLLGAGKK